MDAQPERFRDEGRRLEVYWDGEQAFFRCSPWEAWPVACVLQLMRRQLVASPSECGSASAGVLLCTALVHSIQLSCLRSHARSCVGQQKLPGG